MSHIYSRVTSTRILFDVTRVLWPIPCRIDHNTGPHTDGGAISFTKIDARLYLLNMSADVLSSRSRDVDAS
jgi:hypothetical protein